MSHESTVAQTPRRPKIHNALIRDPGPSYNAEVVEAERTAWIRAMREWGSALYWASFQRSPIGHEFAAEDLESMDRHVKRALCAR